MARAMNKREQLRFAVDVATCGGPDGQEGWATGLFQIIQILNETKGLEMECLTLLKARIKHKNPNISLVALTVLDECMKVIGFAIQHAAIRKVLQRVLKMALPKSPYDPALRAKAAELIYSWAAQYGNDARMLEFSGAADELRLKE
eukprot:CAMPEP_0206258942 /NCGR_PEP_ID=MMETSP0047_2-20121206/26207_1 /ASSEMBLY_ACC=CAM_ASM_000192 /TAXON_ID=195065 /ORGANISM="Chroomonas mesostigmatica_cf, Strain CCMP1168" /LENGTH=145 /DNA_ID=CAMNT_0053685757 /DNA_START=209 /DNA_END=643 /DNA_ORIENTATION=+